MYYPAIILSLVLTAFSICLAKLVEKKVGSGGKDRIGLSFFTPVFILFLAVNIYMRYKNFATGSCLLLNTLLISAVVSSYQDLKYREIEDEIHLITFGIGLIGLIIKGFNPLDTFFGLLAGGGILLIIAVLTRGGMGGADIKLNAVYGAILGLKLSLVSLLIAFIAGALTSLMLVLFGIKGRKDFIPFSPFLSIGALTSFVFGKDIINIYLSKLNM